ncbi:ribosomal protein L11 methyltransferase [Thiobacillus denitrificans ATCC 25259]|uniref:Ribosomal protein L11 methyltransferase n=1 Tax=Thiobacillus denitrificans (strain ATCC 25259 / T1) TaxID=292415 RepID=PRMA_THIDA|nr:50S ribosomal protein L11 methyltransferase [Thiobacillus denitrificans]Q3SMB4.1 RecName: Full=Ribosomal protein L11 methyltransferase; Short=L11 Mtase [Thiobacillus denitrificans ATCC 25259]AAZ96133.1 ribosomal protein L11 methyltransferase [Thiobacillus denitrificans ATCC 25259]
MPWQSVRILVDSVQAEPLSDALMEAGALSVSLEDADAGTVDETPLFGEPDHPSAELWPHSIAVVLLEADADVAETLRAAAAQAGVAAPLDYTVETVAEQDWVRLTQSQFDPIPISARLWIVPTWHEAPDSRALNLKLDPGLAFGTGSHPTTRLCLRWLDANLRGGETLLDYGCGSGILAIAAAKLGARRVEGVDIDPQAVSASRDNAALNEVDAHFGLPGELAAGEYDVVVANILTNPLKAMAPLLAGRVRSGGSLVLSGILAEQAEDVMAVYRPWFVFDAPASDEGWVRLVGVKR